MKEKVFGIILVLIALVVAFDTSRDIAAVGFTFRDGLILAVALLIALRGIMRFLKS